MIKGLQLLWTVRLVMCPSPQRVRR